MGALILITHSHWDHLGGVADLAERTGAKVYMPRQEAPVLAHPADWYPEVPLRPYEADVLLDGDETIELAGHLLRDAERPGPLARPPRLLRRRRLFSGDVLFAGSVGRTDLPFADWDTLVESIRSLMERFPPETVVYSGHGPRRRSAPSSPATRSSPSCAPREVRVASRHTRRPSRRAAALGEGHPRGRGALLRSTGTGGSRRRSSRTRASSRGRRARARTSSRRRCTRSRPRRPLADAPARGTAPVARAYIEHGLHREPQPVKTFFIGPMYRYSAPQRGTLPRALAAQRRGDRLGRSCGRRRGHPALRPSFLRRIGVQGSGLELNSIGDRNCRPAYLEKLNAWLDEHADVLDEEARQKRATSPLRVFDKPRTPESVQRRSRRRRRSANRSARSARRTSPASAGTSMPTASSTG